MFCDFCGAEIPDGSAFCTKCGATVEEAKAAVGEGKDEIVEEKTNVCKQCGAILEEGSAFCGECGAAIGAVAGAVANPKSTEATAAGATAGIAPVKKSGIGKIIIAVAVVAVIAVAAIVGGNIISKNKQLNEKLAEIEEKIYNVDYMEEEEIFALYEEYNELADTNKHKIANRDKLIDAYKALEAIIEARKQQAAEVDQIIDAISYSNIYAEVDTTYEALAAYNNLDEKTQAYCAGSDKLYEAYNEVKNLQISVNESNFNDLFVIRYIPGDKTNYGSIDSYVSGYDIYEGEFTGSITPHYETDFHNDYATPVYVQVAPRYKHFTGNCSFYINLHQTYHGIGLVDSEEHEFNIQDSVIEFSTADGVGEYLIYVENKDSSHSLLNVFGYSADWSDMVHKMDEFDVSKVEISSVSGTMNALIQ